MEKNKNTKKDKEENKTTKKVSGFTLYSSYQRNEAKNQNKDTKLNNTDLSKLWKEESESTKAKWNKKAEEFNKDNEETKESKETKSTKNSMESKETKETKVSKKSKAEKEKEIDEDEDKPKKINGYHLFCHEKREEHKKKDGDTKLTLSELGDLWKLVDADVKIKYKEKADKINKENGFEAKDKSEKEKEEPKKKTGFNMFMKHINDESKQKTDKGLKLEDISKLWGDLTKEQKDAWKEKSNKYNEELIKGQKPPTDNHYKSKQPKENKK